MRRNRQAPSFHSVQRAPENNLTPVEEKRILVFWHVYAINHYLDVVTGQLKLMLSSGLYEKAESIYVRCYGEAKELQDIKKLFSLHEKIKVSAILPEDKYEFPTLAFLKDKADFERPFFAFYLHTKGVSYPGNEGGKHWLDYMNYYNITEWSKCVKKLMEGFDTCGVKLVKEGFPMHYSGNFWWANGAYIKSLKHVDTLDKQDRFSAEMWLCSNNPKAAVQCDKFVDYNTKGKFIPEKNRIVVHTLAYNLSSEVKDATKILYEQNQGEVFEHVIVDLGFPLLQGDKIPKDIDKAKLLNAKENLSTAISYNSQFLCIKNEGVSQNWEMVRQQMKIKDSDVFICADPDERTKNNGWLGAVRDVITHGDKIAWCSLMMKEHIPLMSRYKKTTIGGHDIYIIEGSLNWAQGGFSGKFLNEIKGVPVPKNAPIYGWIESACAHHMEALGYKVAILADYFVEHTECSPLYRQWKTDVTTNVAKGQIDFEKWLRIKNSENKND